MATAARQLEPQVPPKNRVPTPVTGRRGGWTIPRIASMIGLGMIPVVTLVIQPGRAGITTAIAVELMMAALAFRAWVRPLVQT